MTAFLSDINQQDLVLPLLTKISNLVRRNIVVRRDGRLEISQFTSYPQSIFRTNISRVRSQTLSMIDGDIFYPLCAWRNWIKLLFWNKPLTDKRTFQSTLFLIGNGCPPEHIMKWALSSQYWAKDKNRTIEKRRKQVEWILTNELRRQKEITGFTLISTTTCMFPLRIGFERKRQ